MNTIADLVRARAGDDRVGLRFEDSSWTYAELVDACAERAPFLLAHKPADAPFHVGVLLDNVPEFWILLGAAALSGATLVGINPTRRGAELARDLQHTDCALLITESSHLDLLEGAGEVVPRDCALRRRHARVGRRARAVRGRAAPRRRDRARRRVHADLHVGHDGRAESRAHEPRQAHGLGHRTSPGRFPLTPDDVCYSAMPLFHSNAAVAGYTAPIAAGATTVLRRRFSASGFLPDVRKYGVTFFNYVGKPLTYILETPAAPDDADSTLRIGFGNEAAPLDIDRFAQRFGCYVVDGYGSTEGGINMSKTDDTPPGSLGMPIPGFRAEIVDPDTGVGVRPRRVRRARPPAQRRRRDRRDREPRRRRQLRGLLQQPRGQRASACATASTGPATSATATTPASSTSRAATPTGCASTARTSRPRRSSR